MSSTIKPGPASQNLSVRVIHIKLIQQRHKMEKHLLLLMMAFATCALPQDMSGKVSVCPTETTTDPGKLPTTCCASPQDMSGKVFVFPKETDTDHVKLLTSRTTFSALTVCLRFVTDLSRSYSIFSLSTSVHPNAFLLFKDTSVNHISMHVCDAKSDFLALTFPPNEWHSLCATWTSETGVGQLFIDGKPTIKRFIHSGPISGPPITILGQDQDSYGGDFSPSQSFIGMISRVHMWDYVLSDCEINRYVHDNNFTPGNVFNWRALDFQISGQILVEEEPTLKAC